MKSNLLITWSKAIVNFIQSYQILAQESSGFISDFIKEKEGYIVTVNDKKHFIYFGYLELDIEADLSDSELSEYLDQQEEYEIYQFLESAWNKDEAIKLFYDDLIEFVNSGIKLGIYAPEIREKAEAFFDQYPLSYSEYASADILNDNIPYFDNYSNMSDSTIIPIEELNYLIGQANSY